MLAKRASAISDPSYWISERMLNVGVQYPAIFTQLVLFYRRISELHGSMFNRISPKQSFIIINVQF